MKSKFKLFPWFVWAVALSFFAFQFILRLLPGLIMPQIMEKFKIDASSYGLLSSMYYFGYAGAQIPVAFLLDQYGPKKIIAACVLLCALGTLVLSYSNYWPAILVARFLIGVGSAAGFLGTAKVISQWFSGDRYARMIGITFTFGFLGAVYGGKPIASWIAMSGWQSVLNHLAMVGLGIGLIVVLFMKDRGPYSVQSAPPTLKDFKCLLSNKKLILIGICNLLMVGPLEGFADVWGVSYFAKAYEIKNENAAFLVSMIFVGMLFGGPILAVLAEKSKKFFEIAAGCGVLSALIFFIILMMIKSYQPTVLMILMLLVGILGCYQVLIFAIGSQLTPSSLLGITTALLNCINMLGGSFFHGSIGLLLDQSWTGGTENGIRAYSDHDYRVALFIVPFASLLGAAGLVAIRRIRTPLRIQSEAEAQEFI